MNQLVNILVDDNKIIVFIRTTHSSRYNMVAMYFLIFQDSACYCAFPILRRISRYPVVRILNTTIHHWITHQLVQDFRVHT